MSLLVEVTMRSLDSMELARDVILNCVPGMLNKHSATVVY